MILDTFFNESDLFGFSENENYVDQIEAIPLDENEHPVDACFRITLENEQNWYNIFNTIAVSEMAFLESHGEDDVMYEAVDVKKIANTVLDWIKKQFAKIKGVFQRAIEKISNALSVDKKLVREYENRRNYITTTSFETKEGAKVWSAKVDPGEVPAIFDEVIYKSASKYIDITANIGKEKVDSLRKDWNENKTSIMDQARGQILNQIGGRGAIGCSRKDFVPALKKCLLEKEGTRTINVVDAYDKLKNGVTAKDMNEAFNGIKKAFNNMIKEAKKVQKEANKKSDNYSLIVDVCGIKTEVIKAHISMMNMAAGSIIQAVGADYSTNRAILRKAIESSKKTDADIKKAGKEAKKAGKKINNESVEYDEDIICTII